MRYNILFLTKWYPNKFDPQLGVFVQKHAKAVSEKCNVGLVYACPDKFLPAKYQTKSSDENGFMEVVVYYKQNTSVLSSFINPLRYLKANRIGIREVQQNIGVIDVIHVNVLNRPGLIALLIKKLKGIPYIVTEHWTGYASGKYEKKSPFSKWLSKKTIKNAAAVTTVSEGLKKSMQQFSLSNNNYVVIPNVIESIAVPTSIDNLKTKILTVADLADGHKNISGIIKAIAAVSKEDQKIEYHIIGGGPDEAQLKALSDSLQLTDKFIFFHGRQTNEFVYEFLRTVDFVVINSNYETFSVVAAEALVCGKPVITTTCGGPEDFITEEYGIRIQKNDQQQLEDAIKKMICDHKNYDPQKLNNYITEKFNSAAIGEQFYHIYKTVAKKFTVGLSGQKHIIEPQWSVLDIGSGHRPNRRANVLIDNEVNETEHRSGKKAVIPTDKKMVIGDALNMPFGNKEFDFLIASHIAEHIDDPEQFCKELTRVGKRGYIETPGPVDEFFLNEPFHKWIVSKSGNCLVFKEKKNFKPFSSFFYGLYYLNEERTGHKALHSTSKLYKMLSKLIGRSWSHIPKTYTRFYWVDSIEVKVIRIKK